MITWFWELTLIFRVPESGAGGEDRGTRNGARGLKTSAVLFDGVESS